MSDQLPLDPHDPFGVERNLKEDDLRTPERSSRPVSSFSPAPLFSPSLLKYEGGADELPCKTDNADDPNLLNGMSSEEIALLASAADPFANSPVQTSAAIVNSNDSNPSASVPIGDHRLSSSMRLDVPRGLTNHLSHRWKNWRIVPSGIVSVPNSLLHTTNPHELSHGERNAILGQGGLVPVLCPMWSKHGEQGRNQVTKDRPFQLVEIYTCLCANCPYEPRVVRIHGGLVFLEKQQSVNGILVPVTHNQRAHDHLPSSSTCGRVGKQSTLSHTQKELIVKHARLDRNRDLFLKSMIDSPNVPCSDEQIAAPNEFKTAVFNFLRRNAKYLQPSHGLEMTLDMMLEILELLKTIPQERSNVAPTGHSAHLYYKTSGWKEYVWKYIFLVDHDFSSVSEHFTSILLEPIDVAARAKAAGDMLPDNHV